MERFMNHKKWVVALALIATALILTHLPVSEADAAASASDFQIEGSTLTKYRGSDERVTIPDTVEVVGESAFENDQKVQFVVVPKSVKRLDAYVFWGCNNLEEVVLGKGLTSVDEYAFSGCTGLKQITIPENVQSIDAQAFAGCTNLTDIYIPDTVTSIADDAFLNCDNVTIHADEGSVAEKFAQKLAEQQIPVGIAKVDRKSLLLFYTSLYTMGVNAIQVHVGEEQKMIQLTEFVRRKDPEESKNGKVWVENPELHLTMLYYMQDLRRQPNQEITPELNDLQEEIGAHFTKGRYIVPLPEEGNGIPLVKLKSGDIFQPIFTDVIEFQRFNREKKFRPVVVDALKLAQVLPEEAKGIVLNPLGVNMPLTVQKVKKQPEAPVQKPVSVEAQIDAAIREVQAEAGRE